MKLKFKNQLMNFLLMLIKMHIGEQIIQLDYLKMTIKIVLLKIYQ